MGPDKESALLAMIEARKEYDAAQEVSNRAWQKFLTAQGNFTGKFAKSDYPLGPFVIGTTLMEHRQSHDSEWPPTEDVFRYTEVIRCPTSE